jgi:hypothetical protein
MQVTIQGNKHTKFLTIHIGSTFSKHLCEDKKQEKGRKQKQLKSTRTYSLVTIFTIYRIEMHIPVSEIKHFLRQSLFSSRLGVMLEQKFSGFHQKI